MDYRQTRGTHLVPLQKKKVEQDFKEGVDFELEFVQKRRKRATRDSESPVSSVWGEKSCGPRANRLRTSVGKASHGK